MLLTSRDRLGKAFSLLAEGLAEPVDKVMREAFGGKDNWNDLWAAKQSSKAGKRNALHYKKTDVLVQLKAIRQYGEQFDSCLTTEERGWASELERVRNKWAHIDNISESKARRALDLIARLLDSVDAVGQAREARMLRSGIDRVVVGLPPEVATIYQRRDFDDEIEQLWNDGGDRRVWLQGGQGVGKSFTARRLMQEAIANQGKARDELLVWVDSANEASVIEGFAAAADQLRQRGLAKPGWPKDPPERKARALLEVLATCTWRWLIVLDDARAGALIAAGLIPSGRNPNGRVLVTTLSKDQRIESAGRRLIAELFTPSEAEAYLRSGVHAKVRGTSPLSLAPESATRELAESVGRHPLALSIAAATIVSHAMEVKDWIQEFVTSEVMDAAADEPDKGGYPTLIGATYELALERASEGLPEGVVERAAMVAAVQSCDGHPTWLWDQGSVSRWVTGGGVLARHHGVPLAVQRLLDHGIVELRGDTWKQGQVAIHPLAARAVRELAGAATVAGLATAIADEWLIRLTDPRVMAESGDIRRNLEPLANFPDLPTPTAHAIYAMLGYARPPSPEVLAWERDNLEDFTTHLEHGGAIGRARLADEYQSIAKNEAELGLLVESQARLTRAAEIYQQLVDDSSLNDDLRAGYLKHLAEVQESLGQHDQAQKNFTRAAHVYTRLTEVSLDKDDLRSHVVALVELHDKLGNHGQKDALLARADELLQRSVEGDPSGDDQAALQQASTWAMLADQLKVLGRIDEAKEFLTRAAESYQQGGLDPLHDDAMRSLARLHIQTSQWKDAEVCLAGLVANEHPEVEDIVLLASLQKRGGHPVEAAQGLARAAERYRKRGSSDRDEPLDIHALLKETTERVHDSILSVLELTAQRHNRWSDAAGLSLEILDRTQKRAEASPGDHEEDIARAHYRVGTNLLQQGRPDQAVDHLGRSVRIRELIAELDPSNTEAQQNLASTLVLLGIARHKLGEYEDSRDCLSRSVDLFDPADLAPTEVASELGSRLALLAGPYRELGLLDEAVDCHVRCAALWQTAADLLPGDRDIESGLAAAYYGLGWTCHAIGRWDEAKDHLTLSASIFEVLAEHDLGDHKAQQQLVDTLIMLGMTHVSLGTPREAADVLSQAVPHAQTLAERDPSDHEAQLSLAQVLGALGVTYLDLEHLDDSTNFIRRSSNIISLLADLDPGKYESGLIVLLRQMEENLRRLGRTDEADEASGRADDIEGRSPGPGTVHEG